MAPFFIAALVAAGLFGTGTVIKPQEPVLGTVLQGAGVGTLVGGAVGGITGVGTALGTVTVASSVAAGAGIGAAAGGVIGYEVYQRPGYVSNSVVATTVNTFTAKRVVHHTAQKHVVKKVASVPLPPHRPSNI